MKEREYKIEINKKLLEEIIEKFENCNPLHPTELNRYRRQIDKLEYYIKGLEEAKSCIESEINK